MTVHLYCIAPELAGAAKFYGLYSRVARKLGVTPQHVRQVALGIRPSKRVKTALNKELVRIRKGIPERAA